MQGNITTKITKIQGNNKVKKEIKQGETIFKHPQVLRTPRALII